MLVYFKLVLCLKGSLSNLGYCVVFDLVLCKGEVLDLSYKRNRRSGQLLQVPTVQLQVF